VTKKYLHIFCQRKEGSLMKLYEYQVKELFRDAGIAIPKSTLIHRVDQASEAFKVIGFSLRY
jgi:hypothetical protein